MGREIINYFLRIVVMPVNSFLDFVRNTIGWQTANTLSGFYEWMGGSMRYIVSILMWGFVFKTFSWIENRIFPQRVNSGSEGEGEGEK